MSIELKEPTLIKQIEQLASAASQPAEQVLEAAVETYLDELERAAIHDETQTYWAMQAELSRAYPQEYVAIRQGRVVDHDRDPGQLEQRVRAQFGLLPVLIAPAAPAPPRDLRWLGGRLERALPA